MWLTTLCNVLLTCLFIYHILANLAADFAPDAPVADVAYEYEELNATGGDDMEMGPSDYDKHTPTHTGPDRLLYVNYGDGDGSRRLQQTYIHAHTGPVALCEPRRETTWRLVQTTTTWAICCRTSWSPICTPVSGDRASTTTSTVTSH